MYAFLSGLVRNPNKRFEKKFYSRLSLENRMSAIATKLEL